MTTIKNGTELSELQVFCMSEIIGPEQLSNAIFEQLELYKKSVVLQIDRCGAKAINELVRITKDTAPINLKHHGRHYVSCIAKKREKSADGTAVYTWYVKPPCHRLTHLLVKGHALKDGGRTKADPFLKNACDKVFPEYEEAVKKAIENG